MLVPIPDSGILAAMGYAREAGLKMELAWSGAETQRYLSFAGLQEVYGDVDFCGGYFTSRYPMDVGGAGDSEREG